MDDLEQVVRSNLFYNLYNDVLNGNCVTDEEKEFLLFEIENYMKKELISNEDVFDK